jgi:hypothetical protein
VPDQKNAPFARKPYQKPSLTPRSIVEVAALCQYEVLGDGRKGEPETALGPVFLIERCWEMVEHIQQEVEAKGLQFKTKKPGSSDEIFELGLHEDKDSGFAGPVLLLVDLRFGGNERVRDAIGGEKTAFPSALAILINSLEEARPWIDRSLEECWRLSGPMELSEVATALRSFFDLWRISCELLLPERSGK